MATEINTGTRGVAVLLAALALSATPSALAAGEGRFDAQIFRPLAAPRDLVMVSKTEVIGRLSPVLGVYWDAALNPLALAIGDTGKTLHAVGARLQITPLFGIGLFDWMELTISVPFVAWQTSDNLRRVGTEGKVKQTPTLGDVRVSSKVAIPYFNRKDEVKSGFGLAVSGNINLPAGDELAFTSDGALSGGVSVIADYRFNFGLLLASNLGVWIRPEHQFAGVKIGDMAQLGVAAEMYVVQRWGLSVIGEVFGYPSLTKYPGDATQIPAEVLLGLRWQTRQGITITIGGSFGAACGFGAPAVRLFNSITWQPKSSAEQHEVNKVLDRTDADPDHDGVIEAADKCPDVAGSPQNDGCPAKDRDGDGASDHEDQCPDLAAGPDGSDGCPPAHIEGDIITTFETITFAPGSAELSNRAKLILDSVRSVMLATKDIAEVVVEVHTDARERDEQSFDLSHRRAKQIVRWMRIAGVKKGRILARGYGHTRPAADDSDCLEPDELLSRVCREVMKMNRRVLFRITRRAAPALRGILGTKSANLPSMQREGETGTSPQLPSCRVWTKGKEKPITCLLPMKPAVLAEATVLENAKDAPGRLPQSKTHHLPGGGVLPKGGGPLPSPPE